MNTVSKFGKSFNVVETELNSKFWSDHYEGWENSTFDFIIPHLDGDKTFIDIGCWIGPISLLTSQFSKQCICFEPDVIAYNEFKQNIDLNKIKNIHLENAAVSIHSEIELGCAVLGQSVTRDSCKTNVIKCKCFSVKDILDKYNLSEQDISVIKIDVEGHETELLKDKTLWNLNVPMHISFHPGWKEDRKAFFNDVIPFLEHKKIDVSNLENLGNFFDLIIK